MNWYIFFGLCILGLVITGCSVEQPTRVGFTSTNVTYSYTVDCAHYVICYYAPGYYNDPSCVRVDGILLDECKTKVG